MSKIKELLIQIEELEAEKSQIHLDSSEKLEQYERLIELIETARTNLQLENFRNIGIL